MFLFQLIEFILKRKILNFLSFYLLDQLSIFVLKDSNIKLQELNYQNKLLYITKKEKK